MSIPTVRLDDPDRDHAVETLRSACVDYGFFYLEGHGIPQDILANVMQESRSLFDLPLGIKRNLCDPLLTRGYTAMEEETLDPAGQTKGDTKEGYYIAKDVPKTSPQFDPQKLKGPNVWPTPETVMDETFDCDAFQRTMSRYFEEAKSVGFRLVQLLASAIGLADSHFFDEHFLDPVASLRLLHYAMEQSRPEDGVFACGAHSDYGMVTLLLTDDSPGLQIFTKQGIWMDVPPKQGAFVVNLGDMLERWTNGMFRSTLHRVITRGDRERYSIPLFYEPAFDTSVTCLDVCCSENNPPKYPPTTSGEYLVNKYKQTHADFATDDS